MSLIWLLIVFAVVGLIAWALTKYVPMDIGFQKLIVVVAIIGCILYALSSFNILQHFH